MRPVYYERRVRPNFGLSGKWIFRILLIALIAWLGHRAFLFGKGFFDARTATRLVGEAAEKFESGDRAAAVQLLKQAITLDSTNPEAARWMARALDEEGSPQALEYHRLVESAGVAGADDLRRAALSASRHGLRDRALSAAAAYRNLSGDAVFPYLIEARVHAANENPAAQEKALRVAIEEREDSETLSALTAFLLSDPEILDLNATEITRLLLRLSEIDRGPKGLGALRTGLVSGVLSAEEKKSWLDLYRSHPAASASSLLDAARLQIQAHPEAAPAAVAGLVQSLSAAPIASRTVAARWLLDTQNPAAAQTLLPLESALAERDALELWIESAVALGQWDRMEEALKNPLPAFPDPSRLPALARAVKEQGRADEAAALQAGALSRFRPDSAAFAEVLRGLLAAGEWSLFDENLPVLANDPGFGTDALEKLVPVARSQRDSARMLAFYEKLLRSPFLAQNSFVLDRLQFHRLVLGKPVAVEDIEFRLQQAGDNPSFRVTAALGLLTNGRKAKALHVLEGESRPIDPEALEPFQAAVFAAVLAANSRFDEAAELAARIPRNKLTREEEAFLERALAD